MTSSEGAVGIHSGHAAWATVTALDLSTQYAGLDSLWNSVIAEAAAAAGQPVVTAAIQAYGCTQLAAISTLMTEVGALTVALDSSVQSGVDVDAANSAHFGAVAGALAFAPNAQPGA